MPATLHTGRCRWCRARRILSPPPATWLLLHQQGEASTARINSISFHRTADLLVTASDDDSIRVYNTQSGTQDRLLLSKKYGCANITYTHDPFSVITSSNKVRQGSNRACSCPFRRIKQQRRPAHESQPGSGRGRGVACSRLGASPPAAPHHLTLLQGSDYALRYHDLHANRFVRYFRGHTGRVTTLAMSPKSDTFLSAAEDKTVGLDGGTRERGLSGTAG